MGAPSIACMLPIFDAGPMTEDFARRELLPLCKVPVLLGVHVWEEICEPQALAEKVAEAGLADAVNFPSCLTFSHRMPHLLARARRGARREVPVLQGVHKPGLSPPRHI